MADLIKTFHAYGKYFENDLLESFNQLSSKKIDKILHILMRYSEPHSPIIYDLGE